MLLVDDDRDSLRVLTVMLTESRAEVHAAASAAAALEALIANLIERDAHKY